jgi:NtrC-family two-component system response regulator AlgB
LRERRAAGERVLVVDDEKNIRATVALCLEGEGCSVTAAASGEAALAAAEREAFEIAFVDLRLADESGLDLIPKLLALRPELAIVVITAYATIETAVEAMRRGARDYLPKPFTPAQIRHVVEQLAERHALLGRVAALEARLAEADGVENRERVAAHARVLDTAARVGLGRVAAAARRDRHGQDAPRALIHQKSARRSRSRS